MANAPLTWQDEGHTWTDHSASGWVKYREELELIRGKPYVGYLDWPELCRAQSSFECGIMPADHVSGFFDEMSITEAGQKMLDYQETHHA